jgi:hypothetical protein
MKKFLLIGITTIGLLSSSCSQDEVVSSIGAISFDNVHIDKMTRATGEINNDNISEFYVYGYARKDAVTLFTNERVFKKDGAWDYNNTQFWQANTQYAFTAIAPSATEHDQTCWEYKALEGDDNATKRLAGEGSIAFDNSKAQGDVDLVTDVQTKTTGTSVSSGDNPVKFSLGHRLARVKFLFKNTYTDQYINVSNVQMTNLCKNGTYNLDGTNSKWVPGDEEFALTFNSKTLAVGNGTEGYPTDTKYIIPEDEKTYHIKINATRERMSAEAEDYVQDVLETYENKGTDLKFNAEEGNSYVITIEFNGTSNAITFTVTEVTPWDKDTEIKDDDDDDDNTPTTNLSQGKEGGSDNLEEGTVKVNDGYSNIMLFEYFNGEYDSSTWSFNFPLIVNSYGTYPIYGIDNLARHTYFETVNADKGLYSATVESLNAFYIVIPTDENVNHNINIDDSKEFLYMGGVDWNYSWAEEADLENLKYNISLGNSYQIKVLKSGQKVSYTAAAVDSNKQDTQTPLKNVKITLDISKASEGIYKIKLQDAGENPTYSEQQIHWKIINSDKIDPERGLKWITTTYNNAEVQALDNRADSYDDLKTTSSTARRK